MTIHVVIQPADGYFAEVLEPSPGVCQLIAGSDEAGLTVQIPARVGGLSDAAKFVRVLFAAKAKPVPPPAIPVRAIGMLAVDARAGRSAKAAPGDAKAA